MHAQNLYDVDRDLKMTYHKLMDNNDFKRRPMKSVSE